MISSSLKELDGSIENCCIPSLNKFLYARKSEPLEWNGYKSSKQMANQQDKSFTEQKFVTKKCIE